ncbi:hypothetical protein MD484_g8716, partial [Candolleomyces efflorescens]
MSHSSDSGTSCPVLSGPENYQIWKIRIKAKLQTNKVYGVVSGTEPRQPSSPPVIYAPKDDNTTAESTQPQSSPSATDTESWDIKNQRAIGIIIGHVNDAIALELDALTDNTARQLYDYVVEKFEKTNAGSTAFGTILELLELKWDGTSDFADHIGKFTQLTSKLASLKQPLSELFKSYFFLRSLPSSPTWDVFRTATINSVPKMEDLTYSIVTTRAASQVANSLSLTTGGTSESVLKISKKCSLHGNGNHSTDDCYTVQKFIRQEKATGGGGGGTKAGEKERKKGRFGGKGKKKETAKVAEESDDDGGGGSEENNESAHHVYLSRSMKARIEAYLASDPQEKRSSILVDSGCSSNMTPNADWLLPDTVVHLKRPVSVHLGDDSIIIGTSRGTLKLRRNDDPTAYVLFEDVLLVPDLSTTLMSVSALAKAGFESRFKSGGGQILIEDTTSEVFQMKFIRGLYHLQAHADSYQISPAIVTHLASSEPTIDMNTLHRRLGHASERRIRQMVNRGQLKGITKVEGKLDFCEPCTLGKMKKLPFKPQARRETTRPFELLHTDLGGPVTPKTPSGYRYWMVFVDDFTRYPWVFFLKDKSEAPQFIKQMYDDVMGYFSAKVERIRTYEGFKQTLRSDNGGEFLNRKVERYLNSVGVRHETTAAHTPEQNGMAERMNQTIRNSATTMLIDSKLPKTYWSEAMSAAVHTIARTPAAGLGGEIPFEKMFGRKVDPTLLRPFGCTAYALIPKELRSGKFSENARKCILLGYESTRKAYRLLDASTRKIFSSRHVIFDESRNNRPPSTTPSDIDPTGEGDWGELLWTQRKALNGVDGVEDGKGKGFMEDVEDDEDTTQTQGGSLSVGALLEPVGGNPVEEPQPQPQDPQHEGPHDEPAPPNPPPNPPTPPPRPRVPRTRGRREVSPIPLALANEPRQPRARQNLVDPYRAALNEHRQRLQDRRDRVEERRLERIGARQISEANVHPEPEPEGAPINDVVTEANFASVIDSLVTGDQLEYAFSATDPNANLPLTLAEALSGPDGEHWRHALEEELQSLTDNDVFDVVEIPAGIKPISSKPVLRIKTDSTGKVERFKIRIVARGFTQKEGIDFKATFSPVANLESIRLILALAAQYDLELDQMDVTTAYLNGVLEEDLYLSPPDGVHVPEGHCWKLKRSLYGLKQSGRTWNKTLDRSLLDMGLIRLDAETCLYVYREENEVCFLVVYVDDLLLAATSRAFMNEVKKKLSNRFKMKDLGEAKFILGMAIHRDREKREIRVSQQNYIANVLERTGMTNCSPVSTPIPTNAKAIADDPVNNETLHSIIIEGHEVSYKSVVGSLMYAMLATRPDLAFAVGFLGRYAANPKQYHWSIAKRCLRYLKRTINMELVYTGNKSNQSPTMTFHGFVDAAWSDDIDTSKSTGGYVFISNEGAVGWSSKRQPMVSLSSTEAEYISMCYAGQHLAWLRSFLEDIGHKQTSPTDLYNDNQGAIALSKDPQFRARTKHIQRKYHYVRDDLVNKNQAVIKYIPTGDMVADIMTKPLPRETHWKFVERMGLRLGSSGSVEIGS